MIFLQSVQWQRACGGGEDWLELVGRIADVEQIYLSRRLASVVQTDIAARASSLGHSGRRGESKCVSASEMIGWLQWVKNKEPR